MEIQIKIIGICLIILGLVHATFPKKFKWKQELSLLSTINREMMVVHTFFIALILVLVGLLCVTSSTSMMNTPLGKRISLGLGIFWLARLGAQFIGYSTKTWKGKSFETLVHALFSVFWTYLSIIFILISI